VTYGGQVGLDAAKPCMHAAFDAGINFFDGAEVYSKGEAEKVMGQVVKEAGWRREKLVLSTKIFWGGTAPNDIGLSHKHVIEGFHNALRRWQQDYLDLVFCHRPDPDTPILETVRAMDILIRQGKVFYWGTSEWSAAQIEEAFAVAKEWRLTPPTMEQPQYNLLTRERFEQEYAPLWKHHGYGSTIWSPLASGLLTGKYDGGVPEGARLGLKHLKEIAQGILTPEKIAASKRLAPIAKELGCTRAQLALAWCLKNPNVSTVITGASRVEQVHENLKALEVEPRLTDEVMKRIDAAVAG